MNAEALRPKPEMSPEKGELLALEKEGRCVFHGSAVDTDMLEPREAYDERRGSEGPPAIYASDRAEYAIFMALVNRVNCPDGYRAATGTRGEDGNFHLQFRATQQTLDQITEATSGYVYVFDKREFMERPEMRAEFFSRRPVSALKKVQVFRRDLPEKIGIIEKE